MKPFLLILATAASGLAACTSCGHAPGGNKAESSLRMHIYPYKIPCTGEQPGLCLLTGKKGTPPEFLYEPIEGFSYQWGYWYELDVDTTHLDKPMADGSSIRYKLQSIRQKTFFSDSFSLPLKTDGQTMVIKKDGHCSFFNDINMQLNGRGCEQLMKADSAVVRIDKNTGELVVLTEK